MIKQAVLYLLLILFPINAFCGKENESRIIHSFFVNDWKGIGKNKSAWTLSKPIFFENPAISDNKVNVYSLWDVDSLYFAFEVEDNNLIAFQKEKDHPSLYLDDMVEILIDAHNDKNECWGVDDIVYHINVLGQKKDDRGTQDCSSDPTWDGNANYKVWVFGTLNDTADVDKGYRVEIAIPWSELGLCPETVMKIGVNFANGDNDGNGRQLFDWSGAWPLRTPSQYGSLMLKE